LGGVQHGAVSDVMEKTGMLGVVHGNALKFRLPDVLQADNHRRAPRLDRLIRR
jgi:hypothetical protein